MKITENLLRQLNKDQGKQQFRNEADIFDFVTMEEIKDIIRKEHPTVTIHPDTDSVYEENNKDIADFCIDTAEEFRAKFLDLLEEYHRQIDPEIIQYLKEKNWILPRFDIYPPRNFDKLSFDKLSFDNPPLNENAIAVIVFNFPKPLEYFWFKDGADHRYWGAGGQDLKGMVIGWGHFYRLLAKIIHRVKDIEMQKKGYIAERMNDVGDHVPGKYYYVWAIQQYQEGHEKKDFHYKTEA